MNAPVTNIRGEAPSPDPAAIESFLADTGGKAIQVAAIPAAGGAPVAKWFGGDAEGAAL